MNKKNGEENNGTPCLDHCLSMLGMAQHTGVECNGLAGLAYGGKKDPLGTPISKVTFFNGPWLPNVCSVGEKSHKSIIMKQILNRGMI